MALRNTIWKGRERQNQAIAATGAEFLKDGKRSECKKNYANGVPHMGVLIGRGLSQEGEEEAEVRGEGSTRMAG